MLAHLKIRCPFAINWWNFLCWVDELMKLVNSYMECMRYLFIPAKCLICERGMQNYAGVHPLSHGNFCINSKYSWFKHNLSSVLTFQLNCAFEKMNFVKYIGEILKSSFQLCMLQTNLKKGEAKENWWFLILQQRSTIPCFLKAISPQLAVEKPFYI